MIRHAIVWYGLFALCAGEIAAAAPPNLAAVFPLGGRKGTKIAVRIYGSGLNVAKPEDLEVLHRLPANINVQDATKPNETLLAVEIASDAEIGIYPLRVRTPDGISKPLFFAVGLYPDVAAGSPAQTNGQVVDAKSTVNASARPASRDTYILNLKKGERLVAEIESSRLGVDLDPVLEILDPVGNRVAWCDDAFGLGSDPRVQWIAATAGPHRVIVHDATYQRGGAYRLKLGDYPFAEGISPPVAVAGTKADATFWGGTIQKPKTMKWQPKGKPGGWTTIAQPCDDSAALPLPVALAGRAGVPPAMFDEARFTGGHTAAGSLQATGPNEVLGFAVQPQQRWRIELIASRFGSKLNGLMVVRDNAGRDLATGETNAGADPMLEVAVSEGVNRLSVFLEDVTGKTGPQLGYHVRATPATDDFAIELVNPAVNVPTEGYELARVRVRRRQYGGPIQLFLTGDSNGLLAEGGLIEAGQTEGYLALTAHGPGARRPTLAIAGRAGSEANPMERPVTPDRSTLNRWCPTDLQDEIAVASTRPAPVIVKPRSRVVNVVHGTPTDIEFTVERKPEYKAAEVEFAVDGLREFRDQVKEFKIAKELAAATLKLTARAEQPTGKRLLVLTGNVVMGAERIPVTVPPVTLNIVRPFSMEVLTPKVRVARNAKTNVECLIRRLPRFESEVEVRAQDLPNGLTAAPVLIPGDKSVVQFSLAAGDLPDGNYVIRLVAATAMPGQKRTKDYQLPPQEIAVRVGNAPAKKVDAKTGKTAKGKRKGAAKKGN